MNRHHPEFAALQGLLSLLVENAIDAHQWESLERMLENSPAARRVYFEYVDLHAELETSPAPATGATLRPPMRRPLHVARRSWLRYAAAVLIVAGIGLGASLLLRGTAANKPARPMEIFATITDVRHAAFDVSDLPTNAGSPLHGGFLRLKSGEVDVEFAGGAQVTLRGPAVFGINSARRGFLRSGELRAYCPPRARGFTVGAPGVAYMDLGTRFELSVNEAGASSLRVLLGTVAVSKDSDPGHELVRLSRNQAVRFEPSRGVLESIPAEPRELSVADLLRGGDGEGGGTADHPFYIEPDTGAVGGQPRMKVIRGDDRYHRITWLGFVDGIFIPRGGHGPVVLDSAGHTFGEFSPTDKFAFANIEVRADGGIYLHANKGVTLDLAALREHHHGTITRFTAAVVRSKFHLPQTRSYPVDVWMFVDGVPRFKVLKMGSVDTNADVSIGPEDRFLTLVVADSQGNHSNAAVVLKNARLSLTPDNQIRPGSGLKED